MKARLQLPQRSTNDTSAVSMLVLTFRPFVLPVVIGVSTLFGVGTVQAATSNVEQVTVYQGLASVTRTLPIAGTGVQTVIFSCLSPYLNQESLSVQATESVNIGDISIEALTGEQAAQCQYQYQGDAKVQTQQNALANIEAEIDAAQTAKAYLQNVTKATQVNTADTLADNARDIETQTLELNKKMLALKRRQALAKDALNQLMVSSTSSSSNMMQVSVRTASRTPSTLKLHYQVRGAGWEPAYQARLNTDDDQLSVTAFAVIAQQTGENWHNVPLTLSTVNPNQKTTGQLPNVPRLSLYEDNQDVRVRRGASMMDAAPVMMAESMQADTSANTAPLPSFTVSSQNKNGIIEYRLPQRVSIPSDGRRVRTVIGTQSGSSKSWIRSTPSVETVAYWYASAPFLTPEWVDGSLQLYRDDNYVGQSRYNYQMLKEQGIGFGTDSNTIVKELINEDKQGEKGVLNRQQTLTKSRAYQFTNQHNRKMHLQVLGSEPISADDSLKVATTHTPPVTERNWNDNQGIVAWEFDLPSKQSQVIRSTSQVSYPADQQLSSN